MAAGLQEQLFLRKKMQVQRYIVESSREINVYNSSYLLFFLELKLNESDSLGSMNVHSFSPF